MQQLHGRITPKKRFEVRGKTVRGPRPTASLGTRILNWSGQTRAAYRRLSIDREPYRPPGRSPVR